MKTIRHEPNSEMNMWTSRESVEILGYIVFAAMGLWITINLITIVFPTKPDGELWISDDGSRIKTTYYGHYEIQCLCQYLRELNYSCGDRFMGCGAVNCECFNWTARLQNDLGNWRSYHSGTFVQGEGLVCK